MDHGRQLAVLGHLAPVLVVFERRGELLVLACLALAAIQN
jgi:hypothetical protein